MPGITLSPACAADLPAIGALLASCDLVGDDLSSDNLTTFLIARGPAGKLIGTVGLEIFGDCALLRSLAVDAAQRGSGLGEQLTREAEKLARSRGMAALYLLTVSAESFFRRLGYATANRAAAPAAVQASTQFLSLCPASAACLKKIIRNK